MKPLFLRLKDREYEENQTLDKKSILWLKKELIHLTIPNRIINFSKHFTILTEEKILNGEDSLEVVLNLAKRYNIFNNN